MESLGETQSQTQNVSLPVLMVQVQQLELSKQDERAMALYQRWLMNNANMPMAHLAWHDYGRLLAKNQDESRAISAFRAAIEQKSDFIPSLLALGISLEKIGQSTEAISLWKTQIDEVNQNLSVLLNNVGRVELNLSNLEGSEAALLASLRSKPGQFDVISTILHLRQKMSKWPVIIPELQISEVNSASYFGPLSSLAYFNDPVLNLESTRNFLKAKGYYDSAPMGNSHSFCYKKHEKIKVGFLSADFRLHATSVFFAPLLADLNRGIFEVYALDITTRNDPFGDVRQRLLNSVDQHIPLQNLTDQQAVDLIRFHEIDVLVDMSGLTADARPGIVLAKAAPVQVSYLGFIGSSAMESVDYIVTTKELYLEECTDGYVEQPLFLPEIYIPINEDLMPNMDIKISKRDCALPEDGFIYCALVNTYKITPEVFSSWMRILQAVERSVIWLIGENETVKKNLTEFAKNYGIDSLRLIFTARIPPPHYRAYLANADILLDTFPYGNGATAREAILANLPILTRPGKTMMSRLTGHLMGRIGLTDFVVSSAEEYEQFAIALGRSPQRMLPYKQIMHQSRHESSLFKVQEFVAQFGEVLKGVVKFE